MTERARVLEIEDGTAMLECFEDGCESCSSMFCNKKARTLKAAITPDTPVSVGDQVEVHVPPARAIRSGFFVLIFPLIMFLVFYLAFGFVESEPVQVAAGVAGLALGFFLVYILGRRHGVDGRDLPQITRVFETGATLKPAEVNGKPV